MFFLYFNTSTRNLQHLFRTFVLLFKNALLFTGRIFLSGYARQEASGVHPMWKTGQKQAYKRA